MDLSFINWTPIVYHVVLAALQWVALLVISTSSGVALDLKSFLNSLAAILVIALSNYFTHDLAAGALIILILVIFFASAYASKWNVLGAFAATLVLLGINIGAAFFLVAPYTNLEKERIGGTTLFVRQSDHYSLPFKLKKPNSLPKE